MEISLDQAIRKRLGAYLDNETTIDEFKAWLVAVTWSPRKLQPASEIHLANEIKLALAEHSGGFCSNEELRESLADTLNRSPIEAG